MFFESDLDTESQALEDDILQMRPKSTFDPQIQNSILDLFEKSVINDLKRINYHSTKPVNIKNSQLEHVEQLAKDEDLTIKPADKGGAIVIMDSSYYTRRCLELLNDTVTYTKLDNDPLLRIKAIIQKAIDNALENNWIDSKTSQFLINKYPITPVFYGLPKVHKDNINPPLRPIVAGTDSIFDPLAIYVDRLLQPLIQEIPTYLKDTTDFLNCLQEIIALDTSCILFSMDVCSLYTSIPHIEGVDAVLWLLLNHEHIRGNKEFIVELLEIILHNSYFRFQGQYYVQSSGTSMGSAMAPVYANTYMYKFEKENVLDHPFWSFKILTWKRYIDDIFGIWCGTRDELDLFLEHLNSVNNTIKFTMEVGDPSLHFLDVSLQIKEGHIDTTVYHKPTDVNNLLHFSSFHPKPMLKSLPFSQMLRLKRIISDPAGLDSECSFLVERFGSRGYPDTITGEARNRSETFTKEQLRIPKVKDKSTPLLYISKYSRQSFQISKTLRKNWTILHNDPSLLKLFPKAPMMAFKRGHNLKDKLVRAERPPKDKQLVLSTIKKGTFPCLNCTNCNNVIKGETISHPQTGKKFKIRDFSTCLSAGVIYSLKCPCGKLYIGQTTRPVKERWSEHKSTIRCKNLRSPVARHFIEFQHTIAQIKFQVIEIVKRPHRGGNYQSLLSQREKYWIHTLDTLQPKGLNDEFSLSCFL
ncbi:uncharacterized protein [Ambystoma mexicanum]|uniref:uncharacterized protein n=1 Tax=Ambystoma mexicanum TaxID=8296 RepID=UPI0037E8C040